MKKIFSLYGKFKAREYSLSQPQAFFGSLFFGTVIYGMAGYVLTDAGVSGRVWLSLIPLIFAVHRFLMGGYWSACREGKHEPKVKREHVPPHITFSVFSRRPR